MKKSLPLALLTLAASAALLAYAGVASAKDGDVRAAGKCSGSSTSKIKLAPRDGAIEAEFEVDQNRNGVVWNVTLTQNGTRVFKGSAMTKAPSGSFEVRRILANRAGSDRIVGKAVNRATGETCAASATV
jgi:hypothetical protein